MANETMKPSEVLKQALALMDGGKKWCKENYYEGEKCCSLGAIRRVTDYERTSADNESYNAGREYLYKVAAESDSFIDEWNDAARDFSVIEQGFQKAIALAEAEGQ